MKVAKLTTALHGHQRQRHSAPPKSQMHVLLRAKIVREDKVEVRNYVDDGADQKGLFCAGKF
eukprot:5749498-Amphidinium_carterae.1